MVSYHYIFIGGANMKRRFSLLLAVLLILYLFIGCTVEHDISAPSSTPPAKVQTENVQTPEPSQKAEIPPSPVEAKLETEAEAEPEPEPEITYILNKNTKKFHKSSCRSAKQISPKNYGESYDTRDEALARGYSPCGNCKP